MSSSVESVLENRHKSRMPPTAVSYIAVQLFKKFFRRSFWAVPLSLGHLQVNYFAHLPFLWVFRLHGTQPKYIAEDRLELPPSLASSEGSSFGDVEEEE